MLIFEFIKNFFLKEKTKRYFLSNYEKRAQTKKVEFAFHRHAERMKDYFNEKFKELDSTQFYYDVTYSICKLTKPKRIHQIGCFTCLDLRFLKKKKIDTEFFASDFDIQRINYLKKKFKKFNFKVIDLENCLPDHFKNDEIVIANSVLSNIQPEKIKILIDNIFSGSVRFFIIGDIYSKESIVIDPKVNSIPLNRETNYFHPYLSIAKELGLNYFFIPDFTYTSYTVARGIFIISSEDISNFLDLSLKSFIKRQDNVLANFAKTNINKHWKKSERNN